MPIRRGTTLAELLVVVVVIAALSAVALPLFRRSADRLAARSAIHEASSLFSLARRLAISRRATVGVVIDTSRGTIVVRTVSGELARLDFRGRYGVRLTSTRDSMSYDPRGLGYGAANLSVVARRGEGAETLSVSRLGRVRR
jgi:prepilin-type N-terminal cleavage/methylation domain-containing protein